MRINKYIAACGIASRRKGDELIQEGRVSVNGLTVLEPGLPIVEGDVVEVDGQVIRPEKKSVYIMLHKPKGYITTASDEWGRPTVLDLTSDISQRIFPIGRLDYNTSGLLILTNDGEFANLMMHPRNKIYKTYLARVSGTMMRETAERMKKGVEIDGVRTAPALVEILKQGDRSTMLQIQIYEGRNRQIRKMCEAVGHPVLELHRSAIGGLSLGHLKEGHYKNLSPKEVELLKRTALGEIRGGNPGNGGEGGFYDAGGGKRTRSSEINQVGRIHKGETASSKFQSFSNGQASSKLQKMQVSSGGGDVSRGKAVHHGQASSRVQTVQSGKSSPDRSKWAKAKKRVRPQWKGRKNKPEKGTGKK